MGANTSRIAECHLRHSARLVRRRFFISQGITVHKLFSRLVVHYNEILYTKITVTYGLTQRCELAITELPGSSPDNGTITYRKYECRPFPNSVKDGCEKENKAFCAAWVTAGYLDEIAIGFAAVSLIAILFGVSTHSRRRRIWRAVAGLVLLTGKSLDFTLR
jgi:hypothetical protein